MLSLVFIRENPDAVRKALADRHTEAPLDEILDLDGHWRRLLQEVEILRAERNAAGKEMGQLNRTIQGAEQDKASQDDPPEDCVPGRQWVNKAALAGIEPKQWQIDGVVVSLYDASRNTRGESRAASKQVVADLGKALKVRR